MKKTLRRVDYVPGDLVSVDGKLFAVEVVWRDYLEVVEWCLGGSRRNVLKKEVCLYVKVK